MKYILAIILFTITGMVKAQDVVVVNVDRAEIKSKASVDSRTIKTVPKGTELFYNGTISGWYILEDGGFIFNKNVVSKSLFIEKEGSIITELNLKSAEDYTQKELLYLLLQEQKKNEVTRKEIKTIKNIQVGAVIFAGISLIATIVISL